MACPLMVDLVEKFGGEESELDETYENFILNATFYFTHSEAVLPFYTLLGLFRFFTHPYHITIMSIFDVFLFLESGMMRYHAMITITQCPIENIGHPSFHPSQPTLALSCSVVMAERKFSLFTK